MKTAIFLMDFKVIFYFALRFVLTISPGLNHAALAQTIYFDDSDPDPFNPTTHMPFGLPGDNTVKEVKEMGFFDLFDSIIF